MWADPTELFVHVFSDLAFFCAEDEEKNELKHSCYIRGQL